ncbi:two-component system response regulator [Tabrizicola sp. TH137]|uniref:response regulator n=1 Tax=Tabrizicola sp. TH137 TaxID=2067452 RepID=UPI000C7975FC|nr:response regulator [Tabrizicola sp. TH137]PLL10872.1 two-component system response regulator [Tabrizicola sp. TH137]
MTRTILAVDDSKSIRDMVTFTLQPLGYRIVPACDGRDGLDRFRREPVALVITDLNMPVMNGIEMIRHLRADPRGAGIPILMLTTETSPEMKAQGKAAGATGWLSKPFDADMLVAVTRKLAG